MRKKLLFLITLICLAGCSLFSSPTSTVKKFISSAENGDVDAMTKLFSQNAIKEKSEDKIRSNNQAFAGLVKKVQATGEKLKMENIKETVNGDKATVTFLYHGEAKNNSVGLTFELSKENGEWKINDMH